MKRKQANAALTSGSDKPYVVPPPGNRREPPDNALGLPQVSKPTNTSQCDSATPSMNDAARQLSERWTRHGNLLKGQVA